MKLPNHVLYWLSLKEMLDLWRMVLMIQFWLILYCHLTQYANSMYSMQMRQNFKAQNTYFRTTLDVTESIKKPRQVLSAIAMTISIIILLSHWNTVYQMSGVLWILGYCQSQAMIQYCVERHVDAQSYFWTKLHKPELTWSCHLPTSYIIPPSPLFSPLVLSICHWYIMSNILSPKKGYNCTLVFKQLVKLHYQVGVKTWKEYAF